MKWVDKYVYFWQVRGLGKGQFTQILDLLNFNFVAMVLLLLKDYFPNIDILFVFVAAFVIETVCFAGGVILERKFHLIHAQTKFGNDHNDAITEINDSTKQVLERLRRIEVKLMK